MQPVELARKLAKEMDDHRTISIHRVYVPNTYTVYLNPADREQFAAYETQMCNELAEYLIEHARREGYAELVLWTNDVLVAARRIYERAGFTLTHEAPHHAFGHDLVEQTWSLTL